jgi:hypothetical protein
MVHPSIWRVIEWCQKEEATVRTIIQQDAVGYPPVKRTQQRHVQLQECLQNLCRDLTTGQKTIAEFLCGVAPNQAAVSVAMMLVSGDRNSPGG